MSDERLFTFRNPWFSASVGAVLGLAVFSAVVGFIWLPSVQSDAPFPGIWNAICSAAGVPQKWLVRAPLPPAFKVSTVQVTPQLLSNASSLSVGRGATLALRCTMCHGARGVSEANSPNLAGQYAVVIYKQLQDFQSGARESAVMSPMARGLTDEDMHDLAAYYAYLPRPLEVRASDVADAPDIVVRGAPLRNIPACATCHGGIDNKAGSPWLDGLPSVYTKAQLTAFVNSTRHNDIDGQMRNIARNMSPAEIDAAASYYEHIAKH
jgi:cytochrome c553